MKSIIKEDEKLVRILLEEGIKPDRDIFAYAYMTKNYKIYFSNIKIMSVVKTMIKMTIVTTVIMIKVYY